MSYILTDSPSIVDAVGDFLSSKASSVHWLGGCANWQSVKLGHTMSGVEQW
jgi:hypothetical protein